MGKHIIWMIIGCTVPLLLIYLLPIIWHYRELSGALND